MKNLKQRPPPPRDEAPPAPPRPSPEAMLEIVDTHTPQLPPATMKATETVAGAAMEDPEEGEVAMLNVRLRVSSLYAIADRAQELGLTQKQLVCQGLVAMGVPMAAVDLEDKSRRRRSRRR